MADKPPIDWNAFVDEATSNAKKFLDDVSGQTKKDAGLAADSKYGTDALVADVTFFWKAWADAMSAALDTFNKHVVKRDAT